MQGALPEFGTRVPFAVFLADLTRCVWAAARPNSTTPDADFARQFPATPAASLWYQDRNQTTAETERTR